MQPLAYSSLASVQS
jgi:hypothetical protein